VFDTACPRLLRTAASCIALAAVLVFSVAFVGMLPTFTMALLYGGAGFAFRLALGGTALAFVALAAVIALVAVASRVARPRPRLS